MAFLREKVAEACGHEVLLEIRSTSTAAVAPEDAGVNTASAVLPTSEEASPGVSDGEGSTAEAATTEAATAEAATTEAATTEEVAPVVLPELARKIQKSFRTRLFD